MDLVEARKKAKQLQEKPDSGSLSEQEREAIKPEPAVEQKPEPKKAKKPKAPKKPVKAVGKAAPVQVEEKKAEPQYQALAPEEPAIEKPKEPGKAKGEEGVFVDMNFGEDLPGLGDFEQEMVLEKTKPEPKPAPKPEFKKEVDFMKEIAKEAEEAKKPAPAPVPPKAEFPAKPAPAASQQEADKDFYDLVVEDLVQYGYGRVDTEANLVEFLSFRLGNEIYAVPLIRIQQIIKPRPVTLVPGSPDYILGIISLRGMVIPVFDLRRRLGLEPAEPTRQSRIIIIKLEAQELMAGLLVDQVKEVARVPGDTIEPTPAIFSDIEGEFLEGIARYKGQMLIVLRLSHVIVGKKEEGKGQ